MIKLILRRNLLYLLGFFLSFLIRRIISEIIDNVFNLNAPYIYLILMTIGVIIGGATFYYYQISNWRKKSKTKYFGIDIIQHKIHDKMADGKLKQILLILLAGFFDFFEFVIITLYLPNVANISPTINARLGCLVAITSALICFFAFGFKVGAHHKCSLICLSIFFIITLVLELLMKQDEQSWGLFIFGLFLVCIYLINISFNDCIERYLAHYNFLNPFLILAGEGIFEFILAIIFSINKDPFIGIIKEYEENTAEKFVLLVFLLIIYLLLSVIINAYKVYYNVIYTPVASSLTEFF